MTGETFPSDNNEANYTDETAFIPDENVNEAVPVSDEMVDEVVERAEVSANGEKGKISRRAFLGTLAAAIAFANGCSKDKLPESSPGETGDEGTKITDTATDTTESSVDVDTSTVTVMPTEISETEKKKGKPVVEKAEGEYDSYLGFYIYTPENTKVIPGVDYRDNTYNDIEEIQKYIPGSYPGGYLNMEEWLDKVGLDDEHTSIERNGENVLITNSNNNISIALDTNGHMDYCVDGQTICRYKSGKATTKNNRVYTFKSTSDRQFYDLINLPESSVDVLELFATACADGYTGDPLAKAEA